MHKFFQNIMNGFNLFRFNTLFGLHQRATAFGPYKWWSERRYSGPVHLTVLILYILGLFSGLYLTLPRDSAAAYSVPQKAIYTNTGQDIYSFNLANNTESIVTNSVTDQVTPAIYGNIVVWSDNRNVATNGSDIYMKNLTTGVESAITTVSSDQSYPAIYGNIVVWQDARNATTTGTDVYMKNLDTGLESAVTTAVGEQVNPAIYGDIVVWEDGRNAATTGNDIYMKNLITGVESAVSSAMGDQAYPAIYENTVVWQDTRNSATTGTDIYMKNISTGVESFVTTATGDQYRPAVYGTNIVWQDGRNLATTGNNIYMKNISTGTESVITSAPGEQANPTIYGNTVVWDDGRNNTSEFDVYTKNIATGVELAVTTAIWNQITPAIYGDTIIWQDGRNDIPAAYPSFGANNKSVFQDNNMSGVYLLDNLTGQKTLLAKYAAFPSIQSDIVVWMDTRSTMMMGESDIYMKNLSTGVESVVTAAAGNQYYPAVYSNIVVWDDERNIAITGADIYMKNLSTGTESAVTTASGYQTFPKIYGNIVVWQDYRNVGTTEFDIYMKNLSTGVESAVTTAAGNQTAPVIYGDIVVWQDDRDSATTGTDIYMKNLTTGVVSVVTNATGNQTAPVIYGDQVIWQDDRNVAITGNDIYMKNLTTGVESAVSTAVGNQNNPAIYGSEIVWEDFRNGYNQLFLASLDMTPPVFENLPNLTQKMSLSNDQVVMKSPLSVKTKPTDVGSGILKVEYYVDNTLMATSTTSDANGVYTADLNMNTAPNKTGGVTLKARAYDNTGNISDYSLNIIPDPWFFPYNGTNKVDIFAPEQLTVNANPATTGDNSTITATAWDNDAPTRAEISVDGGAFANLPKTAGAASPDGIGHTGTFAGSITMPNKTTANYTLKVYDAAGNVGTKTGTFAIIDNDAPVIASVEPLTATTGDPLTLNIKSTDNIAVTKFQVSVNGAAYVDIAGTIYVLNVPLDSVADIKVRVKAFDAAGNTTESTEYLVKVADNKAPVITDFTSPAEITAEKNVITVAATDNIAPVRATISFDGVVWQDMVGTVSPFTYSVSVTDLRTGQPVEYFVRVYDAAGNFATTEKEKTVYVAKPVETKQAKTETVVEKIAQSIRTFFTGPRGAGTKVLGALTNVTDTAVQIIKETPPAVANTFPYILFILLGIMAAVFFFQAQSEARQSKKLLDILTMEKAIYEDKENFLTLSAHYLRTPATIITGSIDSLENKYKSKLAPIAKSLSDEIQNILKSIENNSYLAHIKKPELEKEKRFLFLSPFLLVPVLLVAVTAVIADLLFIKVAAINISTVNLIVEILVFIIVVQVLITIARHRYTEQRNRREFEQTLSYERSMDRARNKFVDEVGTKIAPYISEIDKNTPKTKDKMVESIREGKHRLSDILYKFSLLAESTKGGFRLIHPASVSLGTQVKVSLGISEKEIVAKQIKIKEDLGDIELKTDPRKIEFIMSSLISNAIKFTGQKTTVGISATKTGKKTNIIVSDEGPGISEEGKLHLFKPFTRTTSALHFDYEGFGLSLYLSKILVNSMGGDIYLDSKVGKGTTVRVEV